MDRPNGEPRTRKIQNSSRAVCSSRRMRINAASKTSSTGPAKIPIGPNVTAPPIMDNEMSIEFTLVRPLTTAERRVPSQIDVVPAHQIRSRAALIQCPRNANRTQAGTHTSEAPTSGRQDRTTTSLPQTSGELSPAIQNPSAIMIPSASAT